MKIRKSVYDESFPPELKELLKGSSVITDFEGRIGNRLILIRKGDCYYFLKTASDELKADLKLESEVLFWLQNKGITIPKVIYYSVNQNGSYLLISKLPGEPAHNVNKNKAAEEILYIAGKALKELHNININNCPFTNSLDNELERIKDWIDTKKIDENKFKLANNGKSTSEILKYLLSYKNCFTSHIFTHGDYCLTNIIIKNKTKYGLIDLAGAGTGDQHRDFSSIEKSIYRNLGNVDINIFYNAYGINYKDTNRQKINYYYFIDQYFYNKIKDE